MSEENVEIVRRMFEAFRKRDWAGALEPVDSDEIEMDVSRSPIEGLSGVYRGREELAFFWGLVAGGFGVARRSRSPS